MRLLGYLIEPLGVLVAAARLFLVTVREAVENLRGARVGSELAVACRLVPLEPATSHGFREVMPRRFRQQLR